jgi:methionine sulfoxide reductase heme-binding subunit
MSTQAATLLPGKRVPSGDLTRRFLLHHTPLAIVSAAILLLFMSLSPGPFVDIFSGTFPKSVGAMGNGGGGSSLVRQLTFATGYLAVVLLALTLLIGPFNLILRRSNPVSSYLRRDVGMWTAAFSVIHVILGFQVHGDVSRGVWSFLIFFVTDRGPLTNSFGLGNWTGLGALVIVLVLLAISTDNTLRELKAKTWKDLQRLNYTLFGLVVLHALFYGAPARITSPFTALLMLTVTAVVAGQAVGIWLWRRRPRTSLPTRPEVNSA